MTQTDPIELARLERTGTSTGDIAVLRLCAGENRFRPDSLAAIAGALDEVEADESVGGLVLTGEGKFFSNGLDLEWMGANGEFAREEVLHRLQEILARLMTFPTVTVAAVNGHAYAGGAMLALACDFRVMRADRGYLCLPEADLGLPFTLGMTALLRARMTPATATAAMVFGARYGAAEAIAAGLVSEAAGESEVLPAALARASALAGKNRGAVRTIKERLYAEPVTALRTETF
jgi:enoyl-CoA hydratase/carnithine racemase